MVRYCRWPVPCIECRRSFCRPGPGPLKLPPPEPLAGIRPALPAGTGPLPLPGMGPLPPCPGGGALAAAAGGGAPLLIEVRVVARPGIGDLPTTLLLGLDAGLLAGMVLIPFLCPTGEAVPKLLVRGAGAVDVRRRDDADDVVVVAEEDDELPPFLIFCSFADFQS